MFLMFEEQLAENLWLRGSLVPPKGGGSAGLVKTWGMGPQRYGNFNRNMMTSHEIFGALHFGTHEQILDETRFFRD